MDFFFNPEAIAVIGASPTRGRLGNNLLVNIKSRYRGAIYPVNPKNTEIEGLRCYPSVSSIGRAVDLGIVIVPAPFVPDAIRDCATAGVKGVIIESAGFAETGENGKALEDECRRIVKETGIRVWGPNCFGVIDGHRNHVFAFGDPNGWKGRLVPGSVSLIVQSGFLASTLMLDVMSLGVMGFAKLCSIGNKIDVDEIDLLEYLLNDPETSTIGMYLEAVPKGRTFIDLAISANKPIILLKGGSSPSGAKAAISHTASLAGDDRIVRGALAQAHVTRVTDVGQLVDLAHALSLVPQGIGDGRAAVLTLSGGAGILSADVLHSEGLRLADLSANTIRRLAEWFPPWMPPANPVDLMAASTNVGVKEVYARAAEIVSEDPGVDVMLIQISVGVAEWEPDLQRLQRICRESGKAAFAWVMGDCDRVRTLCAEAARHGVPAFHELTRVVQAMRACYDRGRRLRVAVDLEDEPVWSTGSVASALDGIRGCGNLDEFDSKQALALLGVPTVRERIVVDADDAARGAADMGYPVVLKGLAADKVHKTELGLVRLGLRDIADVRIAYADLRQRLNGSGRIVVQRQMTVDWEFICGMVRDPFLGRSVMFGMGGVTAELHKDVAFRVAPLTRQDALEMMDSIHARQVLYGFRGKAPVDREALARVLVTLGQIGLEAPWVSEIDINPLASCGGRLFALDATLVLQAEAQAMPLPAGSD